MKKVMELPEFVREFECIGLTDSEITQKYKDYFITVDNHQNGEGYVIEIAFSETLTLSCYIVDGVCNNALYFGSDKEIKKIIKRQSKTKKAISEYS